MPDPTTEVLHRAAPQPTAVPDFGALWSRGRRRRRVTTITVAAAAVVLLGLTAGGIAQVIRPAQRVDLIEQPASPQAEVTTAPEAAPADTLSAPQLQTVVAGDAAFDVPRGWAVYGDDGGLEYRERFCELGQIGPAVFLAHPLPRNWGCRAILLGHAAGLEVMPTDLADETDRYSVWLDEPSTEGEMGGEPVTRWQQDERQANEWRLLRYERLGIFVLARTDLRTAEVERILQTFRSASAQDHAAHAARVAAEDAREARRNLELLTSVVTRAIAPVAEPGTTPRWAEKHRDAVGAIGGHFEDEVNDRMRPATEGPPGSTTATLAADEAFTVTSERFEGCVNAYGGPDQAGRQRPTPPRLTRYDRVSISPATDTIESCSQWFAVDFYLDEEGDIRTVRLYRPRP